MKEITQGVMARTDLYHEEFAKFMMDSYLKKDEFIEKHQEEFPRLANLKIHFRIAVRPYFDKYVYSLRNNKYSVERIEDAPKDWLK